MSTVLQVSPEQIKIKIDNPKRAVDLIRDLLWAEAGRQNVNSLNISFSERIYAKDGGVDGTAIDIRLQKEGLLFLGTTYYQIKWGASFDPRNKASLEKELLIKNKNLKCTSTARPKRSSANGANGWKKPVLSALNTVIWVVLVSITIQRGR